MNKYCIVLFRSGLWDGGRRMKLAETRGEEDEEGVTSV